MVCETIGQPGKVGKVVERHIIKKGDLIMFEGAVYDPKYDKDRLAKQSTRIYDVMIDGKWRTFGEINDKTNDPEASISAALRCFRRPSYGSYIVKKRPRGSRYIGLWEYQLNAPSDDDIVNTEEIIIGVGVAAGINLTIFHKLSKTMRDKIITIMARVSEQSYRRGYQEGKSENAIANPFELRFRTNKEISPDTNTVMDDGKLDSTTGYTIKGRLFKKYIILRALFLK